MAEHGAPEYATAQGNDYAAHEGTYKGFTHLAFIGTILAANILIALAIYGVAGYLLVALVIIFIIAPLAAFQGWMSGTKTSSYVTLAISLVTLALTAA